MPLPEKVYTDLLATLPDLKQALIAGVEYGGDLFHRFIIFDIVNSTFNIILALIVLVTILFAAKKYYKKISGWAEEDGSIVWVVVVFVALPFCLWAIISTSRIIKDVFIPELRVIEVVQDLLPPNPNQK